MAPSAVKFSESDMDLKVMALDDIKTVVRAFGEGARRAMEAGIVKNN